MTDLGFTPLEFILDDIGDERRRQVEKWGEQHYGDGSVGHRFYQGEAERYQQLNDNRVALDRQPKWDHVLLEEVFEALGATDQDELRKELIQVAAVAAAWVEDIDSRAQTTEQ